MAAIFTAVKAFDVEALRRELAAGVDPDILEDGPYSATPLTYAVLHRKRKVTKRLQERLECISVLLEAGASVDTLVRGATPLHIVVGSESAACESIIAMLLEAGADPNFTDTRFDPQWHRSVLAKAAEEGTAGTVRMLISAGAVDIDRALELAVDSQKLRNCAPLLRAGAAIPARYTVPGPGYEPPGHSETCAYMMKISAAGGYKAYEKAHRQRLTAIFLAKFPALPVEMLGRILEFTWDIGGH